jgi:hypothetical protein
MQSARKGKGSNLRQKKPSIIEIDDGVDDIDEEGEISREDYIAPTLARSRRARPIKPRKRLLD